MKHGERTALWVVAAAFVGVIAFTVYMEMSSQRPSVSSDSVAPTSASATNATAAVSAGVIPTGMNPDDLPDPNSRGATVLTLYCAQCHDLPTPAMRTTDEWAPIVARMQERMRAQRGGMLTRILMPPEQDWQVLSAYLAQYGQKPLIAATLSDLDTPAGRAFQATCGQCHGTPDPAQHTAKQWARIVLRMKQNMTAAHLAVPSAETLDTVVAYLQQHADATPPAH